MIVVHTVKVSVHFQNNLLTFVDDFSEQVLSPEEVSRRAVPALVAELVLALVDGDVGPLGQGHQQARVVPSQAALLAAQGAVDGGVHVEDARRDGGQVVRLPGLGDAPGTRKNCARHRRLLHSRRPKAAGFYGAVALK